MSRHEIRKKAFELLFSQELNTYPAEELIAITEDYDEKEIDSEVKKLFTDTLLHKDELDTIIESLSKKRSISRIPKSSLTIMRLALYEMKYDEKVPVSVAINEAVILAKEYCDETDAAFINGLLGSYARSCEQ